MALFHSGFIAYMGTLVPEAGTSGRDKQLYLTVFYGMQLLIPVWDTFLSSYITTTLLQFPGS